MMKEWLNKALATSGLSQSEISRQLTERLGRSVDRAAVNKMAKGMRDIKADEMLVIESVTGCLCAPEGLSSVIREVAQAVSDLSEERQQMALEMLRGLRSGDKNQEIIYSE